MYKKTTEGWIYTKKGEFQYKTPYVGICFSENEDTVEIFRHGSLSSVDAFFQKHKDGMASIGENLQIISALHITENDLNFLINQGSVSTERFKKMTSPILEMALA
jgi:hypothetical protein